MLGNLRTELLLWLAVILAIAYSLPWLALGIVLALGGVYFMRGRPKCLKCGLRKMKQVGFVHATCIDKAGKHFPDSRTSFECKNCGHQGSLDWDGNWILEQTKGEISDAELTEWGKAMIASAEDDNIGGTRA